MVTVFDAQGVPHKFLVAYQESQDLPPNPALRKLLPDVAFRAHVVVMQAGDRVMVVNLRGSKAVSLAKEAVKR